LAGLPPAIERNRILLLEGEGKGMSISKKRTPINEISAPFPRRPNIHTYAV